MFRNHLIVFWRNFKRQPFYSILNISCLTAGIAAAVLILFYIDFEINYDTFHDKKDRIYRVETESVQTSTRLMQANYASSPGPLSEYILQDYPEVENSTRFYSFFNNENVDFQFGDKTIEEPSVLVADPSVLDIFNFDFIFGEKEGALDGPNKIIISETLAKKIFNDENPVGEILNTNLTHALGDADPEYDLIVQGVFKDYPENNHLSFNALLSSATDPREDDFYFNRFTHLTYVLLNKEANPDELAPQFADIYKNYLDIKREGVLKYANHVLVPLTNIHLQRTGGLTYIYIFSAIAFLMILIAIISYVNMITAQGSKRTMEIGVRKVLGSSRKQLIKQFLTESFFYSFFALIIALSIVSFSINPLNTILDLQLNANQIWQTHIISGLIFLVFLVGILGGAYPAFFLSAIKPIASLKGKIAKGIFLRRVLIAVQFGVVIFVLICTGMVYHQLDFMRKKDLGFNKDQIIRLDFNPAEGEKLPVLKDALLKSPLISSIGVSTFLPGAYMPRRPISADAGSSTESQMTCFGSVDYDFFKTMEIELLEGRYFSAEYPNDGTKNVIVNKAFGESFGLDNLIGEKIRYGDKDNPNFMQIIGVVENFHQSSLHDEIAPQIFNYQPSAFNLSMKLDNDITEGIAHIQETWATVFPNIPLEYRFLDNDIQTAYELDKIRGKIFMLFSFITILIAFIGLFGLSAYMTNQRRKEIGIRKVMGASSWNLVLLFGKDFLLLVLLAALPAFFTAWYFINGWLEEFAYRVEMNYILFALVLALTLLLTFLTTSIHATRSAQLNPAKTLKND